MKARVKSTGVLVDVIPRLNINSQHSRDYLYVCDNSVDTNWLNPQCKGF